MQVLFAVVIRHQKRLACCACRSGLCCSANRLSSGHWCQRQLILQERPRSSVLQAARHEQALRHEEEADHPHAANRRVCNTDKVLLESGYPSALWLPAIPTAVLSSWACLSVQGSCMPKGHHRLCIPLLSCRKGERERLILSSIRRSEWHGLAVQAPRHDQMYITRQIKTFVSSCAAHWTAHI